MSAGKPAAQDVMDREVDWRIAQLQDQIGNRHMLLRIIRDPKLDLYRREQEQTTLEDIGERIRQDGDVRLRPAGDPGTFVISFFYPDKRKARNTVNELAAMLRQENATIDQADADRWQYLWHEPIPFHERLEIVDPASLPGNPGRAVYFACGAIGGLLLAGLIVLLRRRPKFVMQIAACGLAGCALAGALSLLVNEQHTATAVMRMSPPFDPARLSGAAPTIPVSQSVERLRTEVLDSDGFYATLRNAKFTFDEATVMSLYKRREQVFGIRMLDPGSEVAAGSSFEITFSHPNENIARALVSEVVSEIDARYKIDQEATGRGDKLEIAKNPTVDDQTVTLQLMLAGGVMGMLLAVARWSAPEWGRPSSFVACLPAQG